ncbi:hypothetical protein HZA96_05850 [Candidatus Woesearchaeota archaeon]|nr:hypothetical protein [Candidatus Woesearchaeota archaeon]
METNYLIVLAIVLLIPTIIIHLTKRFKYPLLLYIILAGIVTNKIVSFVGVQLPAELGRLLVTIAVVALLFEIYAKIKIKHPDYFYVISLKVTLFIILISSLTITFLIKYLYAIENIFAALIAAVLISATSYSLFEIQERKWFVTRIHSYLESESILSPALAVALAFIFSAFAVAVIIKNSTVMISLPYLSFFVKIIIGIGAGIVIGIILSKYFSGLLKSKLLFIFLFGVIIATYILTEALKGSGIIAVIVMSLFFGNMYLTHKEEKNMVTTIYNNLLYVFLFIFLSFYIQMPFDLLFYGKALIVFLAYLLLRTIACFILLPKEYSMAAKLQISLLMAKEIDILLIAFFILLNQTIAQFSNITSLLIIITLYSIITSILSLRFSKFQIEV